MAAEYSTTENFRHLVNQLRWVTRISVALSSAVHADDIYSVLLSGMVSPSGLGFTHAMVFEADSQGREMTGRLAVRIQTTREYEALQRELEDEGRFLEQKRQELASRASDDESACDELRMLQLGSQWVTLSQRLGADSPETDEIRRLRYTMQEPEPGQPPTLFQAARQFAGPRVVDKSTGNGSIPKELQPLLHEQFAVVPLRTVRGLRALILIDRGLTGEPLTNDDVESLDWFATQGALALQNADLISDLERTYEELKTVDQLKSNFLSIISHELRTPLTAITGFIELLINGKAGEVSDAQKNLLIRVAKNTSHLSNMVNDLIEIAEIKAEGLSDVRLVPVDPLSTLFATLPRLEFRRRGTRVEIEPVFEGVVPNILCDPRALERIYFHLLDNAVKFSPPDETVTVEYERTGDDRLRIAICDRGSGIAKDKLQRIFDEFYQIDNSLTRSHEGLGLGLAVTRVLVQSTRGEIHVESTEGVGSRFVLVYPVANRQHHFDI